MKTRIFELTAILLVLAGSFSSCKNDSDLSNIDFSNIENLHAQPLPVIQKCVEGKWKCVEVDTWGFLGVVRPINTFVNIMKDSVDVTGDENGLNQGSSFSYRWQKEETLRGYTTYVMGNNKWFFDNIRNDTLRVIVNVAYFEGAGDSYLFLRIK